MQHVLSVDDLAELADAMPESASTVFATGHTQPGDGGAGTFGWFAQSTLEPDGGTVIASKHSKAGRWQRLESGPFNVRWFGARGDGTDATDAVQAALDAAKRGGSVYVPSGRYVITKPLKVHQGATLQGDGLLSILQYRGPAGTGCLQSVDPSLSMKFHIARLNIEVFNERAFGIDLRGMSYSRFDDLSIHLRADRTSGFFGPSTPAGHSPYYNLFTSCHIAGTPNYDTNECVGFDFFYDDTNERNSANANIVMGGRISTCQTAIRCYGTGNMFYGVVLESDRFGFVFDVPPGRLKDQQLGSSNDIIGGYCEHVRRVLVQKHANCYLTAEFSMITGYENVFDAVDTSNCIVITPHDGSLPQSRSLVNRRIDFPLLMPDAGQQRE